MTGKKCWLALQQQDFKCALSGVELVPESASLDHIRPISDGGEHSMENLQFVHASVNRMKQTMSAEEFVLWCKRIAENFE